METVYFATGNAGKVKEMSHLFKERGYSLEQVEVNIREIHALDVEDVARRKAIDSYSEADTPSVIVEDTGFYVSGLNGFPGAEASFFAETVGVSGILELLRNEEDRSAYFKTAIAFYDGEEMKIFTGRVEGAISRKKRGEGHHADLPYDSYFMPENSDRTFAEKPSLKEKFSHRKEATEKLLKWLS